MHLEASNETSDGSVDLKHFLFSKCSGITIYRQISEVQFKLGGDGAIMC